MASAGAKSL
jgi:hypothetical protein